MRDRSPSRKHAESVAALYWETGAEEAGEPPASGGECGALHPAPRPKGPWFLVPGTGSGGLGFEVTRYRLQVTAAHCQRRSGLEIAANERPVLAPGRLSQRIPGAWILEPRSDARERG